MQFRAQVPSSDITNVLRAVRISRNTQYDELLTKKHKKEAEIIKLVLKARAKFCASESVYVRNTLILGPRLNCVRFSCCYPSL